MERINLLRETIAFIKKQLLTEQDPVQRADYADTLDRLEASFDYELELFTRSLKNKSAA